MSALLSTASAPLLVRDVVTWRSDPHCDDVEEWIIVDLPAPEYVQRIRFRNGAGLQRHIQDRGIRAYSATYRSLQTQEPKRDFKPPRTSFGNPVNYVPVSVALMCDFGGPGPRVLRGAWTVWHVGEPILTDQIAVICHEPGSVFSAIAEIELYGVSDDS